MVNFLSHTIPIVRVILKLIICCVQSYVGKTAKNESAKVELQSNEGLLYSVWLGVTVLYCVKKILLQDQLWLK